MCMFCRSLFVILAIVLSVLLRYTDSDYPFGIFKLFLQKTEGEIKNGQYRYIGNIEHTRHWTKSNETIYMPVNVSCSLFETLVKPIFTYLYGYLFVLLRVFTFRVPCCDVRYDFRIKLMFGSSLHPVVFRRAHVLFTLFVFVCAQWCLTHSVLCFCFVFPASSFSGLSIFYCPCGIF